MIMGPAGIAVFFDRFAIRVVALLRLARFIVPLLVLNACGGPSAGPRALRCKILKCQPIKSRWSMWTDR